MDILTSISVKTRVIEEVRGLFTNHDIISGRDAGKQALTYSIKNEMNDRNRFPSPTNPIIIEYKKHQITTTSTS